MFSPKIVTIMKNAGPKNEWEELKPSLPYQKILPIQVILRTPILQIRKC